MRAYKADPSPPTGPPTRPPTRKQAKNTKSDVLAKAFAHILPTCETGSVEEEWNRYIQETIRPTPDIEILAWWEVWMLFLASKAHTNAVDRQTGLDSQHYSTLRWIIFQFKQPLFLPNGYSRLAPRPTRGVEIAFTQS